MLDSAANGLPCGTLGSPALASNSCTLNGSMLAPSPSRTWNIVVIKKMPSLHLFSFPESSCAALNTSHMISMPRYPSARGGVSEEK